MQLYWQEQLGTTYDAPPFTISSTHPISSHEYFIVFMNYILASMKPKVRMCIIVLCIY